MALKNVSKMENVNDMILSKISLIQKQLCFENKYIKLGMHLDKD